MADPARMIKPEVKAERAASAYEERPKSEGSGDAAAKPTDVNKESSSQDAVKEEGRSVSCDGWGSN